MWKLQIQDPSGEIRTYPLNGSIQLGRNQEVAQKNIPLRDPLAPLLAALVWPVETSAVATQSGIQLSPYWIRVPEGAPSIRLGDLEIREAQLPAGMPVRIAETVVSIQPNQKVPALPAQPQGTRPWLTLSESGRKTLWNTRKASATPLSIYLAGETGTGKEVLAHLIHSWSDRASGPFVPLHCGALPVSLAESELFGHVKGAFTGASQHRTGALMQAHGGTLFLDEIGDLPLDIQVKLLRFLENGEIRPVGADRPSRADVRIICATHHPLLKLVEEGKFRRDLYYRIASVTIQIPALRDRPEDIEMLALRFSQDLKRTLSARALLRLQAHAWPGNVRELRHAIERACGLAGPFTSTLDEEAFEFLISPDLVNDNPDIELGAAVLTLDEMERAMLLKALRIARGNRAQAAKILGIARSTLFEMLKRHRIQGPKSANVA